MCVCVCRGKEFEAKVFYVLYDKIDSRVLLSYYYVELIKLP